MEKMKILVVDDEEPFLDSTRKLLSGRGLEVATAASGREALEILEKMDIHVVILDVKMPGMDGIATLKEMKNRFPMVAVIMLTGHATIESAIEGLKIGATEYLMKPTGIDLLIERIEAAFKKRQQLEQKIRRIR